MILKKSIQMSSYRTVLGIDPGSTIIGYGAVQTENRKLRCLTYGIIEIKEKDVSLRLPLVKKALEKLISEIKPDLVVLEKLFFFKNMKTVVGVLETRGVIILTIAQKRIPLIELTPLELKKALTGYGRASKGGVQKILKLILNLKEEPRPDDAADALALAVLGAGT